MSPVGFPRSREELMAVAILGLILLAGAGVLTAAVVTSNTTALEMELWGVTISDLSLGAVFIGGMLTTLVAVAGIVLLTGGIRRGRRLATERRTLREENDRLAQQVESTGPGTVADAEHRREGRRAFFGRRREVAANPPGPEGPLPDRPAPSGPPVDSAGRPM
jgi:hypothetical protein